MPPWLRGYDTDAHVAAGAYTTPVVTMTDDLDRMNHFAIR